MRKSVLGLAAALSIAIGAAANAQVEVPLNPPTVGLTGSSTGDGSSATINAGIVELYNATGAGDGMVWARYDLSVPVPVSWINGLTYTTKVLSQPTVYTASPLFHIDADGDGIEGNPPLWHTNQVAANLNGDMILSSDVAYDAPPAGNGGSDANFLPHTLIGTGEIVDGWYPSDGTGNGFDFGVYTPTYPAFVALLPRETIDATDLVHSIYLFNGGSSNFDELRVQISEVHLFIPEPASLGLLGLGGLLMLKRRRTA